MALLGVFILLDAVTWNNATLNLNSRVEWIFGANGTVTGTHVSYTVVRVGITAEYMYNGWLGIFEYAGTSINLALIWFIITIAINLSLIWYSGIKRMSELTKDSKTETIPPLQQKTN